MPELEPGPEEAAMRMLVEHGVPEPSARADGACLTDDTIAAVLSNTLLPEERVAVNAHLATCTACRTLVAELAPAEQATRRTSLRLAVASGVAAAAAVLLALFLGSRKADVAIDTDSALSTASAELEAHRPGLFTAFAPLGHAERLAAERETTRGGLGLLHPFELVLERRPRFTWVPVPGAKRYELTLYRNDGERLWHRTVLPAGTCDGSSPRCALPYPEGEPALAPDSACIWELRSEGALGTDTDRRTFRVAAAEVEAAFESAVRVIRARVDEPIRNLLTAHLALRRGLLAEAELRARRHVAERPDDTAGRETLYYLLMKVGSPEAASHLPGEHEGGAR